MTEHGFRRLLDLLNAEGISCIALRQGDGWLTAEYCPAAEQGDQAVLLKNGEAVTMLVFGCAPPAHPSRTSDPAKE